MGPRNEEPIIHTEPVPCENPQNCANGYCVIISERIILKLDMDIDHIITYAMIYLVCCISRIDENITDWKVYHFLDTLYLETISNPYDYICHYTWPIYTHNQD